MLSFLDRLNMTILSTRATNEQFMESTTMLIMQLICAPTI